MTNDFRPLVIRAGEAVDPAFLNVVSDVTARAYGDVEHRAVARFDDSCERMARALGAKVVIVVAEDELAVKTKMIDRHSVVIMLPPRRPLDDAFLAGIEKTIWQLPDRLRHSVDRFVSAYNPVKKPIALIVDYTISALILMTSFEIAEKRLRYTGRIVPVICQPDPDVVVPDHYKENVYPFILSRTDPKFSLEHDDLVGLVVPTGYPWLKAPGELAKTLYRVLLQRGESNLLSLRIFYLHVNMGWMAENRFSKQNGNFVIEPAYRDELFPHAQEHALVRSMFKKSGYRYNIPMSFGRLVSNSFGPVDSFGYRISEDKRLLIDRPLNHVVIAVFGNSATHGDKVFHDETFPVILERKLTEVVEEDGIEVSVINYGMCGFTIYEEMHAFQAFTSRLIPDIVISHSGANDCFYGIAGDMKLVGEHDIIYACNNFIRLYGEDELSHRSFLPIEMVSRAYANRVRQFARFATGLRASFILGLQPSTSAKKLNRREEEAMANWLNLVDQSLPFPGMLDRIIDAYAETRSYVKKLCTGSGKWSGEFTVIDIEDIFKSLPESEDIFLDWLHLTPQGNAVVADIYCDAIVDLVRKSAEIRKLRQADVLISQGNSVADAVRAIGVTEVTYYRGRQEHGGLKSDQVRRLKDLEAENTRLRKAVADLTLDKLILAKATREN